MESPRQYDTSSAKSYDVFFRSPRATFNEVTISSRLTQKVVRFATDNLTIPAFLVGADFLAAKTRIIRSRNLCIDVCKVVGALETSLMEDSRYLDGEFVLGRGMGSGSDLPINLYLHGGAHSFMSPKSHRVITSRLSSECRALVYALDYRLSPESIYPDVLVAYFALANGENAYGSSIDGYTRTPGRRVFIAGDRYVFSHTNYQFRRLSFSPTITTSSRPRISPTVWSSFDISIP
jgi:hypothetical protein